MERQARCTRRSLGQVQTRLPAIFQVTCVLLAFCGSPAAAEGLSCTSGDFITPNHMRALEDLIGNQARDSCDVTFSFMPLPDRDADYRHKACYLIAATPAVKKILQTQQNSYKSKSTNHNHSGFLLKLLDEFRDRKCFVSQNRKQECYSTVTKSPADMLTMVKDYLSLTKEVLPINISPRDCEDVYAACKDSDQGKNHKKEETTTTPDIAQCQCSCPTSGSTSSTLSSIKAIAASPEAIGMKKPTPTQFMPLASRQGGARVARTLQNLPATPDSLQSPETPRTPTVSTSPSTVATEALSITDALEPTLRGTRRPPGLILGSHQTSTPGSVTEKIPIGSTDLEPVSETTETTVYQPSTEDIIVDSTEGPVSVTKEITPHRMSTEEDIIGSTKGHISVTTNPVARQSPTREKIIGNNEVFFSMDIEITTHQPSTEHNLISSPEVPLSLTTISDTHKTSTKDNVVGSTEGPIPLSTQAVIHHMSKENSRRTEDPLFMTTETAAHLLSTEVNLIGSTEAPMFVTEHIIKQTSSEKEKSLHTMNTVLTTARATSLRSSSQDETSGHSEVPKSVIDWHQSNELNTPKTERPTTFPSTSLIPEDSTRATPVPDTGRDTSQVHARHPAPGVFQARRQGPLQSDRRGAETDGTRHDSNFLPLYGSGSRKNSDQEDSEQRVRIYVVVPCVLGFLLSLCGLLYYRWQNQILRRQLQQAGVRSERQEEGPLQRLQRDELEVEMDEV